MAPRKKKAETPKPPFTESQQLEIEDAIQQANVAKILQEVFAPAALIKEFLTLKAYVEGEQKRLSEFLKPSLEKMQACKAQLHAKALEQKVNGFPTDEGTAYLSPITSHLIDPESGYTSTDGRKSSGREALLDWMLDNWEDYGSEGAQIGIAKAMVDKYREATQSEAHPDGVPPPGLKLTTQINLNIKKS